MGNCAGTHTAAFTGMGVLISYLVLFVRFYFYVYKPKRMYVTQDKPAIARNQRTVEAINLGSK